MGSYSVLAFWGLKDMKRLAFLIGGAASLSFSACNGSNEDQALGNQQQDLNDENAAGENGPNPSEAQEQNIDAM